ncbi:hypothetical protein ATCC90586_004945 [Pythium insidiosum]|nr:hypothetical protein ATCC90586_004945 [Pythium insidiosum]
MALQRVLLLLALCGATLVAGSSLKDDPYTDSSGNVVVPGETPREARAAADDSTYTVLSNTGPMAGVARPPQQPHGNGNGNGVRSIRGREYLDRM